MTPAVGLALGLAAALFWGLTDITATITSRRVGTLLAAAGMQVAATAIVVLLFLASGQSLPSGAADAVQVIAVGALSAVGYLATYQAFRLGPLSVVSPVMSAYGGLTVILAVIVLGETLTGTQAAGAVVATLGVVMAGVVFERDIRRTRFVSRGVLFALVAMLLWGWFTILLAGPVRSAGWLPVIAVSRTVTAVVLWAIVAITLWYLWSRRARRRPVGAPPADPARALRQRSTILLMAAMGIFDALGYVVFAIGLEGSMAWLVGLAASFAPIVTVLFGVGWLQERLRPTQWLGIGMVVVGVVIIGLR
jgi:drug/metabolite transporter (DMT)-like permease